MSSPVDFKSLSVLVIDDEVFMRQLIIRVLNELGTNQITSAKDGDEGLAKVAEVGSSLDIILCDLEMPEMNGFEFVRQLRSSKHVPNPNIPVLIITGHSDQENIKEAVNSGINGFLVKPISKINLETRVKSALKGKLIDPGLLK